eukprot:sb/3462918/
MVPIQHERIRKWADRKPANCLYRKKAYSNLQRGGLETVASPQIVSAMELPVTNPDLQDQASTRGRSLSSEDKLPVTWSILSQNEATHMNLATYGMDPNVTYVPARRISSHMNNYNTSKQVEQSQRNRGAGGRTNGSGVLHPARTPRYTHKRVATTRAAATGQQSTAASGPGGTRLTVDYTEEGEEECGSVRYNDKFRCSICIEGLQVAGKTQVRVYIRGPVRSLTHTHSDTCKDTQNRAALRWCIVTVAIPFIQTSFYIYVQNLILYQQERIRKWADRKPANCLYRKKAYSNLQRGGLETVASPQIVSAMELPVTNPDLQDQASTRGRSLSSEDKLPVTWSILSQNEATHMNLATYGMDPNVTYVPARRISSHMNNYNTSKQVEQSQRNRGAGGRTNGSGVLHPARTPRYTHKRVATTRAAHPTSRTVMLTPSLISPSHYKSCSPHLPHTTTRAAATGQQSTAASGPGGTRLTVDYTEEGEEECGSVRYNDKFRCSICIEGLQVAETEQLCDGVLSPLQYPLSKQVFTFNEALQHSPTPSPLRGSKHQDEQQKTKHGTRLKSVAKQPIPGADPGWGGHPPPGGNSGWGSRIWPWIVGPGHLNHHQLFPTIIKPANPLVLQVVGGATIKSPELASNLNSFD